MIHVLYFARLKESLGKDAERLELPAGVSDVAGLTAQLNAAGDPVARQRLDVARAVLGDPARRTRYDAMLADPALNMRQGDFAKRARDVEFHGQQNTAVYTADFRRRLATVNRALQEAHLAPHDEPDFSILGPDPKCLNSVRLGFYSSARDWYLDSLIGHLVVHREIPQSMDALRATTYAEFCSRHATFTPEAARNAAPQSCFAHPFFVSYGFSSVYVPQSFSPVLELETTENEVSCIGSSAQLERACSIILAACGYFDTWHELVMDLKEDKIVELEGLEPVEETPEWLVNTLTLVERLQRIAQRSLKTRSIITFS